MVQRVNHLFCFSASADAAFALDDGEFDYVFNLAAETKYGQTEPVSIQLFDVL